MRLLQVRVRTDDEAACLLRELAVYSPKRLKKSIFIELEERSTMDLLALLTAVETCLAANDIRTAAIELDGKTYTIAPSPLSQ